MNYFDSENMDQLVTLPIDSLTFQADPIQLRLMLEDESVIDLVTQYNSVDGNPEVIFTDNLSQFLTYNNQSLQINPEKAKEILDQRIYELLPKKTTRQDRVDFLFKELTDLIGERPDFTADLDNDGDPDTFGSSFDELYPGSDSEIEQSQNNYSTNHDIVNDPNAGFITRLDRHAEGTENEGKTLQYIYDLVGRYLTDITKEADADLEDEREEYESESDGYLQFRNLNQGIIVRKQEGDETGIETLVEMDDGKLLPSYLGEGFTITMWVKFLDKTSTGTLFNYGNPTRLKDPKGFKLETFVLNKNEFTPTTEDGENPLTWGEVAENLSPNTFFKDNEYERFLRLVVKDHTDRGVPVGIYPTGKLYDSHIGISGFPRSRVVPELGYSLAETAQYEKGDERFLLSHIRVPIDFNEWFFIVASFNPDTDDSDNSDYENNPNYWNGNIVPGGDQIEYTSSSGYGSKCKVEIISKSDLLRARGNKI